MKLLRSFIFLIVVLFVGSCAKQEPFHEQKNTTVQSAIPIFSTMSVTLKESVPNIEEFIVDLNISSNDLKIISISPTHQNFRVNVTEKGLGILKKNEKVLDIRPPMIGYAGPAIAINASISFPKYIGTQDIYLIFKNNSFVKMVVFLNGGGSYDESKKIRNQFKENVNKIFPDFNVTHEAWAPLLEVNINYTEFEYIANMPEVNTLSDAGITVLNSDITKEQKIFPLKYLGTEDLNAFFRNNTRKIILVGLHSDVDLDNFISYIVARFPSFNVTRIGLGTTWFLGNMNLTEFMFLDNSTEVRGLEPARSSHLA